MPKKKTNPTDTRIRPPSTIEPELLTLVWDEADARFEKHNFMEIIEEHDCLDPEHVLYDAKINLPVTELQINNVVALGVKQTISVRKNGDKIEVIDGRQRVKWARYANKQLAEMGQPLIKIPIKMERGTEIQALATMVSTNEVRTADDIINLAHKANELINRGCEIDEIATWFNCTGQTVKNRLAVLELSDNVQKACRDGLITVTESLKMRKEPHEKQNELLKAHITAEGRRKARREKSVGEDGKPKKKKTTRSKAPSKAKIRELIEAMPQSKTRAALEWAIGDLSTRKAKEFVKELN